MVWLGRSVVLKKVGRLVSCLVGLVSGFERGWEGGWWFGRVGRWF